MHHAASAFVVSIPAAHGLTKIKTIGDSYMAVAGVPACVNDCVVRAAQAALDIRDAIVATNFTLPTDEDDVDPSSTTVKLHVRIGLHCGPVVAGVLGTERLQYDVWGDTVNVASRMESASEPDKIQASDVFVRKLALCLEHTEHPIRTIPRGIINVKGKGPMHTSWIERLVSQV